MLKDGIYEVMGNTVKVEDNIAFDLDSNEEIPTDVVITIGTFIKELDH